jgi:hypothetical protein
MQAFARVFFHVQPGNAYFFRFCSTYRRNLNFAELGDRFVELRYLVALGKIRIKIIFAREDGSFIDAALQRHGRQHREFNRSAIQYRQRSGKAEAHGTNIRIRRRAKFCGAGTEDLALGQQLDVNFQSDDRFVFFPDRDGNFGRGGHTGIID